jgi:hypothetical protein
VRWSDTPQGHADWERDCDRETTRQSKLGYPPLTKPRPPVDWSPESDTALQRHLEERNAEDERLLAEGRATRLPDGTIIRGGIDDAQELSRERFDRRWPIRGKK